MFDLSQDREEQRPLDETKLTAEATTARRTLNEAIQRYRGVRPAAIVAQAGPKGASRDD